MQIAEVEFLGVPAGFVPGDADGNGIVDMADFEIIRMHFLEPLFGLANGDLDFSGFVDLDDFGIWKTNVPGGGGPATVPEPATFWLSAIAMLLFGCFTRRQRARN